MDCQWREPRETSANKGLGSEHVSPSVAYSLGHPQRAVPFIRTKSRLDQHELGRKRVVLPVLLLGSRGVDDVDEARAAPSPRPLRGAIKAVELRGVRVADEHGEGVVLEERRPERLALLHARGEEKWRDGRGGWGSSSTHTSTLYHVFENASKPARGAHTRPRSCEQCSGLGASPHHSVGG